MKKVAVLFMTLSAALVVVCLIQARKIASQQAHVAALNTEAAQKSDEEESLRASEKNSLEQARKFQILSEDLAASLQARQKKDLAAPTLRTQTNLTESSETVASTNSAGDKSGFGEMISKMMSDPESRKFIRNQQLMMMDQLYAPLVKQLALNPDESEKFKDLLSDNMMKGADNASSLFSGSTNQTQALTNLASAQESLESEVKMLLGDDRYAAYKDYQLTVGERMQLNQFKQMSGSENPLTDQQTESLLKIMKEEKAANTAATGQSFPDMQKDPANFQAMMSDESLEKLLQSQETVNDRVYSRANDILNPDQMTAFGKFQTNQLQMMRMGMTMARKLFGPDKSVPGGSQ